jgi:hypothetical protein
LEAAASWLRVKESVSLLKSVRSFERSTPTRAARVASAPSTVAPASSSMASAVEVAVGVEADLRVLDAAADDAAGAGVGRGRGLRIAAAAGQRGGEEEQGERNERATRGGHQGLS